MGKLSIDIDLKKHMLSNHEGQKTFDCAICDDTFEQKIKLQNHIESAHGKKVPLDSLWSAPYFFWNKYVDIWKENNQPILEI